MTDLSDADREALREYAADYNRTAWPFLALAVAPAVFYAGRAAWNLLQFVRPGSLQ